MAAPPVVTKDQTDDTDHTTPRQHRKFSPSTLGDLLQGYPFPLAEPAQAQTTNERAILNVPGERTPQI
jgi:hypothetical protein